MSKFGEPLMPEQPDSILKALTAKCIECHWSSVYGYIYPKVGKQHELSTNLTHEVFHRFFIASSNQSPEEIAKRACLKYLLTIAKFVIRDDRTSKGSMMYHGKIESATIPLSTPRYDLSDDPTLTDTQVENELQELLSDEEDQSHSNSRFFQMVDMLSNEYKLEKEILVLRYFYDMVPEVIGTILKISVGMIRKREKTALDLLRELLKPATSVKERR